MNDKNQSKRAEHVRRQSTTKGFANKAPTDKDKQAGAYWSNNHLPREAEREYKRMLRERKAHKQHGTKVSDETIIGATHKEA